jgi:hypothetical protein
VLAVVHDADHDRSGRGRHLDEIEASLFGGAARLIEGNDADLLSIGTDESDGAQMDLIVDTNFIVDSVVPPDGSSPLSRTCGTR